MNLAKKSCGLNGRGICLLIILVVCVAPALATLPVRAKPSADKKVPLRYTRRLPRIDKVGLQKLKTREMWFESIEATKFIEGSEAQAIASLWRTQNLTSISAICHYPVYGIKFYSRGKVILYASLCWECDNILVMEPTLGAKQGFKGGSKKGQELLKVFTSAFPQLKSSDARHGDNRVSSISNFERKHT